MRELMEKLRRDLRIDAPSAHELLRSGRSCVVRSSRVSGVRRWTRSPVAASSALRTVRKASAPMLSKSRDAARSSREHPDVVVRGAATPRKRAWRVQAASARETVGGDRLPLGRAPRLPLPARQERLGPCQHAGVPTRCRSRGSVSASCQPAACVASCSSPHRTAASTRSGSVLVTEDLIKARVLRRDHGLLIAAEAELGNAQRRLARNRRRRRNRAQFRPANTLRPAPASERLPAPRSQNERVLRRSVQVCRGTPSPPRSRPPHRSRLRPRQKRPHEHARMRPADCNAFGEGDERTRPAGKVDASAARVCESLIVQSSKAA